MGNIYKWLEQHPVKILVSIIFTAVSITATIILFFTSQKVELTKLAYQNEINDLKREITNLKHKEFSIIRDVGGTSSLYDVTQILIKALGIRKLDKTFSGYDNSKFFVSIPEDQNWSYLSLSLIELTGLIYGNEVKEMESQTAGDLGKKKLHLWKSSEMIRIPNPYDKDLKINLFPMIRVEIINPEYARLLVNALSEQSDFSDNLDESQITQDMEMDSNIDEETEYGEDIQPESNLETKEYFIEWLEEIFNADQAAYVLYNALFIGFTDMQVFPNSSFVVYSAQKKLNVLYLHTETIIRNVEVEGLDGLNTIYIDKELFYFAGKKYGLGVNIEIPTTDRRGEAFSWADSWLNGLRVPIDVGLE